MENYTRARNILKNINFLGGDLYDLPSSKHTFSDGGPYKIEVPTINTFKAARKIFLEADKLKVKVNRITETLGIFRHQKQELKAMKT